MNDQEFEKFKMILETEEIQDFDSNIANTLSFWLPFLTLTKRFDDFSKFKVANINVFSFLMKEYEYKVERAKINQRLHTNFLNDGYLFHITKEKNVDLILENGILTLSDWKNQNVYKDCDELNRCWANIVSKNGNMDFRLIEIPKKSILYEKRFDSIYLTSDIKDALALYGNGSELVDLFLDAILSNLGLPYKFKYQEKEKVRNEILNKLSKYSNISDNEKQVILNFYDQYYEEITDNFLKDKGIIMVPKKKIIDENITDGKYQKLIKKPEMFDDNFTHCQDIEYNGSISNEGLIAITTIYKDTNITIYNKDTSIYKGINKVKLKVRRNDLKL